MKHSHSLLRNFALSLMIIGGALGLGTLLTVPAAAASADAATTWTANFRAVNSTPAPGANSTTVSRTQWTITLSVGCQGSASKTEVARGDTLDVSCVVDSELAYLVYTFEWETVYPTGKTHVEEHSGVAWHHECGQDEIAQVTFTDVGSTPSNPTVTRSTECVVPTGDSDDDPT